MYIKVKNFKIFKEESLFEIVPITLLTGPNNSGKSTVIKLLRLLNKGVKELKFLKNNYNNSEFKNLLHWNTQDNPLVVTLPCSSQYANSYNQEVSLFYEFGFVQKVELFSYSKLVANSRINEPILIIECQDYPDPYTDELGLLSVSLNIDEIIDRFFEDGWSFNNEFIDGETSAFVINNDSFKDLEYKNEQSLLNDFYHMRSAFIKEYTNKPKDNSSKINLGSFLSGKDRGKEAVLKAAIEAYQKEIKKEREVYIDQVNRLKKDQLINEEQLVESYVTSIRNEILLLTGRNLYRVFIGEEDVTHRYYDEIIKYQNELFSENFEFNYYPNLISFGLLDNIEGIMQTFLKDQIEYMETCLDQHRDSDFTIKPSRLHQLIFTEKYVGDDVLRPDSELDTFFSKVILGNDFVDDSIRTLTKRMNYLSPRRGNHKKIIINSNEHDINKLVFEYVENTNRWGESDFISGYIEFVLSLFNITGKLKIEAFHDQAYCIEIEKTDGTRLNISDYGFGISQLLPIVLQIVNLYYREENSNDIVSLANTILIIEEPESNLHPDFQAKLADFFAFTIQIFKGPNLILETHSEYLIRRLQYLVANKQVNKEDVMINYFNHDDTLEIGEAKVKRITIEENGNLSDSFGTGFLDENTKLQFELLKLKNRKP